LTAPLFGSVSSLEYCNLGTASAIPARRFDRGNGNVRHYRLCAPSRGTRRGKCLEFFKTTD
jgi:hypothetical protein